MKLEGKMRNISSKEIQVDTSNKSNNIFIAHCTFSLHIVALKNEIGRKKCEILTQKKYKSTTATNPTVLQVPRKVAKWGEDGQEALAQLCVMKIFIKLAQTCPQRIYGSNHTPFCLSQSCFGRENELQS